MGIGPSSWHATAGYLYILGLDDVSLAWEYLRRNTSYQSSWFNVAGRSGPSAAAKWGLRYLEDPGRDARVAQPLWHPFPPSGVSLTRDADGEPSVRFQFWRIRGDKSLVHDGMRLQLTTREHSGVKRAVIAPDLGNGEPYAYCVPAGSHIQARCRAVNEFAACYDASHRRKPRVTHHRPTRSAIAHMRILQAFDGTRVGASQRDIAIAIFGNGAVKARWTPDSELRAQIRYLLRRGNALVKGRYRLLLKSDSS